MTTWTEFNSERSVQSFAMEKDNSRHVLKEMAIYCLAWLPSTLDLEVDFGFDCMRLSVRPSRDMEDVKGRI